MNKTENNDRGSLFAKGERAPAEYFTGTTWITNLVSANDPFNTVIAHVVFEAGARNFWHRHPGGQILICTGGDRLLSGKGQSDPIA